MIAVNNIDIDTEIIEKFVKTLSIKRNNGGTDLDDIFLTQQQYHNERNENDNAFKKFTNMHCKDYNINIFFNEDINIINEPSKLLNIFNNEIDSDLDEVAVHFTIIKFIFIENFLNIMKVLKIQ